MRNVLMIAYNFPPATGSGVHRPAKFAKYLAKSDWWPKVVTAKITKSPTGLDAKFASELVGKADVYPVTKGDFLRKVSYFFKLGKIISLFEIPDFYIWWLIPAYLKAFEIIKNEKIDLIYTTSYPLTNHLIGYLLKRVTGLPWVADFRDEWTKNPFRIYEHGWHKKASEWLEKKVLKYADLVVSVTPTYTQQFLEINGGREPEKFVTITNGFDKEDFARRLTIPKNKLTITYAGVFYQEQKANYFIKALQELIAEGKLGDDFQFKMVGGDLHGKGLVGLSAIDKKYWENLGYLPHREAVEQMKKSTALLLIVDRARGEGNIPGKTFEYIASGRPLLVLAPKRGEAVKIVREHSKNYLASPDRVAEIKKQLLRLYKDYRAGKLKKNYSHPGSDQYSRERLTKRLAGHFNELSRPKLVALTRVRNQKMLMPEHLDHLASFADEIYVYDDGSTDGTFAIAQNHPAVKGIVRNKNWYHDDPNRVPDAFHLWRKNQQIMEKAKKESQADWFIFLDNDERLDADLIRCLPALMSQRKYDAYCFNLYDFYITEKDKDQKYAGDITQIRKYCGPEYRTIPFLFRAISNLFFPEGSHREPQGFQPEKVAYLDYKVKHYGKAKSLKDYRKKASFYQKFRPQEAKSFDKLITGPIKKNLSDFGRPLLTWEQIKTKPALSGPCIYRFQLPDQTKGKNEYFAGLKVKHFLRRIGFNV